MQQIVVFDHPDTVSVYARYFDKKIKFKPSEQNDVFGSHSRFIKNFKLNEEGNNLRIYARMKYGNLTVLATASTSESPLKIYEVDQDLIPERKHFHE